MFELCVCVWGSLVWVFVQSSVSCHAITGLLSWTSSPPQFIRPACPLKYHQHPPPFKLSIDRVIQVRTLGVWLLVYPSPHLMCSFCPGMSVPWVSELLSSSWIFQRLVEFHLQFSDDNMGFWLWQLRCASSISLFFTLFKKASFRPFQIYVLRMYWIAFDM